MEHTGIHMHVSKKEMGLIEGILNGTRNPNAACNQKILNRPHVAVTLEGVLDQAGLTDEKLTQRLSQIINRKPERQTTKTGDSISNVTVVDNNALNAIRVVWQAKGKFTEKHEHNVVSNLKQLSDDQLDAIITQGNRFIQKNKNELSN